MQDNGRKSSKTIFLAIAYNFAIGWPSEKAGLQ
jgi:hypothetical protein